MKVRLDSKVHLDLLEIMEHYEDEGGAELAAEFYGEFRRYVQTAGKRPYSFPAFEEYRRVNLNKFPYHFLFEVIGESMVRIVVLKHNRRDPDFGLDR